MTLQPKLHCPYFKDVPSLMLHRQPFVQEFVKNLDSEPRPVPAIFRLFHRFLPEMRWPRPIGEGKTNTSAVVKVATLRCSTPLNMKGKICLVRANDLSSIELRCHQATAMHLQTSQLLPLECHS